MAEEYLAEDESAILTGFLRRSVTEGTAQGYQAGIEKWKEYLGTLDSEHHPGQYLEKVTCQDAKAQRIVLFFMAYLYMSDGLCDEQIKRAVTCVSYCGWNGGLGRWTSWWTSGGRRTKVRGGCRNERL